MQREVEEELEVGVFWEFCLQNWLSHLRSLSRSNTHLPIPPHQHHPHYPPTLKDRLPSVICSAGCFPYLSSLRPRVELMRQVLLLSQIYGFGNWSLERLNDLSNCTELVSNRAKASAHLTPQPLLFSWPYDAAEGCMFGPSQKNATPTCSGHPIFSCVFVARSFSGISAV